MADNGNQLNLTVVALVALVAIVGLVALVMSAAGAKTTTFATGSELAQAKTDNAASDNLAGNARLLPPPACNEYKVMLGSSFITPLAAPMKLIGVNAPTRATFTWVWSGQNITTYKAVPKILATGEVLNLTYVGAQPYESTRFTICTG